MARRAEGKGANLALPTMPHAADDAALFRVIRDGISETEMPGAWEMIDHEVWQVAAFVRTLGRAAQESVPGDPATACNATPWGWKAAAWDHR